MTSIRVSKAKSARRLEAVVCDANGLAVFELIRGHRTLASAVHCAFDLLELDGKDLRQYPIEKRKELLAELLRGSHLSIVLNEHFEEGGEIVFREACKLGCEGIVSKRLVTTVGGVAFCQTGSRGKPTRGGTSLSSRPKKSLASASWKARSPL